MTWRARQEVNLHKRGAVSVIYDAPAVTRQPSIGGISAPGTDTRLSSRAARIARRKRRHFILSCLGFADARDPLAACGKSILTLPHGRASEMSSLQADIFCDSFRWSVGADKCASLTGVKHAAAELAWG